MFNYLGSRVQLNQKPINIYNYGSNSGLQLILHINKMNAVDLLNHEIGARVIIHDPRDLPFVAEYGINVRPKDMSAIEVTLAEITRLGPPWGSCVPEDTRLFFEEIPFPYSILGCEKLCRHRHLTRRCACTGRQYLRGSVLFKMTTKYDFCEIENATQYDCMNQVIEDIEKRKISCNCKAPCHEMIYKYISSSSELNEKFFRAVKAIRTLDKDSKGNYRVANATHENMMVGVKIYYNTLQIDHDSEVASYSWQTLVANVGGNLGFFMGLTLFTFVEILEFLWDIIMTVFRRRNKLTITELNQTNRINSFSSNSFQQQFSSNSGINAPPSYRRTDSKNKSVEFSQTNKVSSFSRNSSSGFGIPSAYHWNNSLHNEK
nr:amiloride-sensitive sodium channel subunit beta-like [Parasteatoda tepidariorum]